MLFKMSFFLEKKTCFWKKISDNLRKKYFSKNSKFCFQKQFSKGAKNEF